MLLLFNHLQAALTDDVSIFRHPTVTLHQYCWYKASFKHEFCRETAVASTVCNTVFANTEYKTGKQLLELL